MEFRIIRSSRKTISLQITPEGELLVRCPNRMSRKDIDAFVSSKEAWIQKHLPKPGSLLPPLTPAELHRLMAQARKDLTQRTEHFAPLVGVGYGRITIRGQKTRWGSCSGKGNLNYNCLLMLAPEPVRDYVVVHELCHRKEMNHGAAFWTEVERHLPDYRESRSWLKVHGAELIGRLP